MCGRYVLAWRPGRVRSRLADNGMPSDGAPDDDEVRDSYNFAPGYYGLVYREDVPDYGARQSQPQENDDQPEGETDDAQSGNHDGTEHPEPKYKLQAMKWGLIPFWTKRNPDYGTMMRTINCRDDSLATKGGMWQTMKQRKRCIVIAQGFYEWLKKNDGKERLPHYIKRKDGELMCLAGLWDCVQYEDSPEKLYTYTIITTDANKQMGFLHDRMPVIMESGSKDMFAWLNAKQTDWNPELQSLLRPYAGELEIYPVSKDVGKVGNNSPSFIVPIDSAENKQNIANFFGNQKQKAPKMELLDEKTTPVKKEEAEVKKNEENNAPNANTRPAKRPHGHDEDDAKPRADMKTEGIQSPPRKAAKSGATSSPVKTKGSPSKSRTSPSNNSKITSFFAK